MSCATAADGRSDGWSSFISELLARYFLPLRCQFDSLDPWLASLKGCDINLFFWIQCCRLRLIPCPLALVLFVLLCWVSSICSCLLSCHPGSVATSYTKYSSATWTLPFALFFVAVDSEVKIHLHCDPRSFTSLWQAGCWLLLCSLFLCALNCFFSGLFTGSNHVFLALQSMLSNYLVLGKVPHVGMWWSMLSDKQHTSVFCVWHQSMGCLYCWYYYCRHSLHSYSLLALNYMNVAAGHSGRLAEQRVLGYDPLQNTASGPWACLLPLCPPEDLPHGDKSSDMLWPYSPSYWQWKAACQHFPRFRFEFFEAVESEY